MRLIVFAALVSLGTLLLIAGLASVVFLPGSLLPAAVMAAGGVLLAAAIATPVMHNWLPRAMELAVDVKQAGARELARELLRSALMRADTLVANALFGVAFLAVSLAFSCAFCFAAFGQATLPALVVLFSIAILGGLFFQTKHPIGRLIESFRR